MTPRSYKLVLLLALSACHAKKADGPGPMSSTGLPVPDGGASPDGASATGDTSVAADGSTSDGARSGDLAADRGVSPQVTAYNQFLDEQFKAWSTRWATCFNAPAEALSPGRAPIYDDTSDQHAFSLEIGLVMLDAAKAKACLDALKNMSCDWLAGESFREICGQVLVGKVASGGFCASPEDCQSATDACVMTQMQGCTSRCSPRPARAALGESCGDRQCVAGGACYMMAGAAEARCHALGADGASCPDRQACAAGTWCQPAGPAADPGTCRTLQAGLACQGSWQCPYAYACVIPAGGAAGTCQAGRKKGEACTLHGKDTPNGPYSDCANTLFCYPDASNQYRCGPGRELNEACGEVDVGGMNPLTIFCRAGACRADAAGKKTCQLDQKLGAACNDNLPCEANLACLEGKCVDPIVGLGQRCTADGTTSCAWGARCAISPVSPTQGTCVRLKAIGEACSDPADCEAGASCNGGTCVRCS